MELLRELTIPEYIVRVQMSKKRRKKYYRKNKKGTWKPRQLPKTYRENLEKGIYSLKNDKYLLDEDGNKVVANPQAAGTPKYRKLSGNDFASGYGSPHIRAKLVRELKDFFQPYTDSIDPIPEDKFPLWIDWHLYTTIPKRLFDLSNFWFYYKYFEDCLFSTQDAKGNDKLPVIPDDNVKYITKPGTSPILHPIQDWDHRKFVFKIYHDDRTCLQSHKIYQLQANQ